MMTIDSSSASSPHDVGDKGFNRINEQTTAYATLPGRQIRKRLGDKQADECDAPPANAKAIGQYAATGHRSPALQ
jgi:hypothetical protein